MNLILSEEVEIKSIQCFCGGCQHKVEIRADFEQKQENIVNGNIYTYFSCPRHGAVKAKVNGVMYSKPSDLFKVITIEGNK